MFLKATNQYNNSNHTKHTCTIEHTRKQTCICDNQLQEEQDKSMLWVRGWLLTNEEEAVNMIGTFLTCMVSNFWFKWYDRTYLAFKDLQLSAKLANKNAEVRNPTKRLHYVLVCCIHGFAATQMQSFPHPQCHAAAVECPSHCVTILGTLQWGTYPPASHMWREA